MPYNSDATHHNPALQAALERIYTLHRKDMDFRLDSGPYRDLLIKLGNPQNRLPPVIHVAGTNGKGSTIAMMRALAENRGLKVHAYTSPHLFRFNERLRVAGTLISVEDLLNNINYINTINNDSPLTFFEFTTALMFHIFASVPADLCLIETGMGGRLDCTNVLEKPDVTVITSISYDHTEFLGAAIKEIAGEKAGIIKEKVPVIVAKQPYAEAFPVIEARAKEMGAPVHHVSRGTYSYLPENLTLKGDHQRDNAAAALLAMRQIYPDIVWPAYLHIHWPGRFQRLKHDAIDLIYDGAHNENSLHVLGDTLRNEYPNKRIIIGLAIQDGKDMAMIKKAFANIDCAFAAVDLPVGRRPQMASALAEKLKKENLPVLDTFQNFQQLVDYTVQKHSKTPLIITGSLYAAQLIPEALWPILDL